MGRQVQMADHHDRAMLPKLEHNASRLGAWWLPAGVCSLSLAAALAVSLQPPLSGPVALVFPPWWSAMQSMISAAGIGVVVRLGAVPFIVVVQPDRSGPRGRIRRSQAWLVLDPQALGGCGLVRNISE
jgi:hypothetical protein